MMMMAILSEIESLVCRCCCCYLLLSLCILMMGHYEKFERNSDTGSLVLF